VSNSRWPSRARLPGGLEALYIALDITDEGVGIPPNVLPRIFDALFSTKKLQKHIELAVKTHSYPTIDKIFLGVIARVESPAVARGAPDSSDV